MIDLKDRLCKCTGCYYWRSMSSSGSEGVKGCHYMLDTGEPRGISPKDCYKHEGTPYSTEKYIPGKPKMRTMIRKGEKILRQSYSIETKEAAIRAVLGDKEPQTVVRERYGIAESTLAKWLMDARKQQKEYFDYADNVKAEQSRAEQSRAEQSRAEPHCGEDVRHSGRSGCAA